MNQKSIINLLLVAVAAVAIAGLGYLFINRQDNQSTQSPNYTSNSINQTSQFPNPEYLGGITVNVFCIDKIPEKPCTVGGVVVYELNGTEARRQVADGNSFKVFLEPRDYYVEPLPGNSSYPVVNNEKQRITIKPGQWVELKISYWDGRR